MSENMVNCKICGKKIDDDDAIYVSGKPYCDGCYKEAERLYGDY